MIYRGGQIDDARRGNPTKVADLSANPHRETDGPLLAAAPELLEALKGLLEANRRTDVMPRERLPQKQVAAIDLLYKAERAARKIIAKVEGR